MADLCRDTAGDGPCPFVAICHETRQRLMHYASPPMRGEACWAYQKLRVTVGIPSDEKLERAAIQNEVARAD